MKEIFFGRRSDTVEKQQHQPHFETAREVHDFLLDRTGSALMSGDFDMFASCFALPQEIHTFDGSRLIKAPEDLRKIFNDVRAHFKSHNVTELVRTIMDAEFRDPDTVATTHVSRPLNGSLITQDPYPVFSILKRVNGVWKVAHSEYAIRNEHALTKALTG